MEHLELLRAKSRGCRLQVCSKKLGWVTYGVAPSKFDGWHWRVHPSDVYMDYGPIAEHIRQLATGPFYSVNYALEKVFQFTGIRPSYRVVDDLHQSLWLLFEAELQRDRGL